MKKLIIAGIGAATIAAGITLAGTAQAAPCAYFGDQPDNAVCGAPDVSQSIQNAKKNLQANFDVGTALSNLGYNLTHGVGAEDQNAG